MVVLSGIVFDLDDPDCEYEQLETNDRMCLDRIGSTTWQLTDISIGATCNLQGEHTLAFGFGLCLVQNVATDAEVDPALLLQVDLVRHKTSREVFLCEVAQKGESLEHRLKESWDNKASAHEPGTASLSMCALNCRVDMQVAVFASPRCGHFRVSGHSVIFTRC